MKVSIVEIAEKANVSPTTVSRAFNNTGYVNEKTKEKILAIAAEFDYQPKKYMKHRGTSSSNTIAVIVPDISNPFFVHVIRGIEEVCNKQGYNVFICNSEETPNKEIRCLTAVINNNIRGVIIGIASETSRYNIEYLKYLNENKFPIVLVDRNIRSSSMDSVTIDNYGGASMAVQALIDNGHREIAILSGSTTSSTGLDRLNGYIDILKSNHIPIREEYILYGDFKAESGYELTKKLFSQGKRVTAIFASNNQMANGCLRALSELNMEVPDNIALIVFGQPDENLLISKRLSCVVPPVTSLGEESARILMNKLEMGTKYRKVPCRQILFPAECLLRGSEAFPKHRR